MDFGKLADKSLRGELLERDEMKAVLEEIQSGCWPRWKCWNLA